ncbi:MAG: tryptophan 7-halogenase [Xanthomonadales bacterium]|nr:tryptophan 7-halogenase [Xanthomonadales bacterium]
MRNGRRTQRTIASAGPIKSIAIVGGGTTGWIVASLMAKKLNSSCDIQLIESAAIGRLGVGEATVPSIKREVFDYLEIPEDEWMSACHATFKLGINFVNWTESKESKKANSYFHLFGEIPTVDGIPLTHYWLRNKLMGKDVGRFDESLYKAAAMCSAERAPLQRDGTRVEHYAYHFDAQLVADYLSNWAQGRGVKRIEATVAGVDLDARGWVSGLQLDNGEQVTADLYIDCSGFRGLLINETMKVPFTSFNENLLVDRAIAMPTDNEPGQELEPFSTATALSAGWSWNIPLQHRTGNGYVYSSAHISSDEAELEFRKLVNMPDKGECRHLKMRIGRNSKAWTNNVVAFGLSYCFIEPLESTGIYSTYAGVHQFLRYFPDLTMDLGLQEKFNERMAYMVDDIRDFIVMHYVVTNREDSSFWRTCKYDLPYSDNLKEVLELHRAGVPVRQGYAGDELYNQFEASFDRFWTNSNYMSVLIGSDKFPEKIMPILNCMPESVAQAQRQIKEIKWQGEQLKSSLPSHREYCNLMRDNAAM